MSSLETNLKNTKPRIPESKTALETFVTESYVHKILYCGVFSKIVAIKRLQNIDWRHHLGQP